MHVQDVLPPLRRELAELRAGVVCASAEGRTVYANPRIENMVGPVTAGVPGSHWAGRFGLAHADGAAYRHPQEIPLLRALEDGGGWMRMLSRNQANGVILEAFTTPVTDSFGACLGSVGVFWPVAIVAAPPRRPTGPVVQRAGTDSISDSEHIVLLLAALELSRRLSAERGPTLTDRALSLVRSRYAEDWTLASLAAALHSSPRHLTTVVSAEIGAGLMHELAVVRVQHARRLLSETDHTVTAIARSVGLADAHRFSRTFRRVTGMSPAAYRARCELNGIQS